MEFKGIVPPAPKPMAVDYLGDNGHWEFPEQMGDGIGFIYVIFDTVLNRGYIGKKLFRSLKGKNKGKESDWKRYKSSSKILKEIFSVRPKTEFRFICIEQYKTKGGLSYAETWSQCIAEVPTTQCWYNVLIGKVTWKVTENVTDRHKERLGKYINLVKTYGE